MTNNHKKDITMHRKSSSGFAAIEALLVIIIVAMIGLIGWYVWHTKQAADKTFSDSSSSTSQASGNTTLAQAAALTAAKNIYAKYIAIGKTGQAGLDAVKDDITPQLFASMSAKYASGTSTDWFVCSSNLPVSFSAKIAAPAQAPQTAAVQINETYANTSDSSFVTVGVDTQTFKLNGIVCQDE